MTSISITFHLHFCRLQVTASPVFICNVGAGDELIDHLVVALHAGRTARHLLLCTGYLHAATYQKQQTINVDM